MRKNYRIISFTNVLLLIIAVSQLVYTVSSNCTVSRCQSCSSNNVCSTCDSGYNLTGSSCCADNTIKNCASCLTNGDVCESCVSNSYCLYSNTCSKCGQFLSQCANCKDCSTCIACNSTLYAVNASSKCQLCQSLILYCSECSYNNTCTKCINASFAVNSTSHLCQLCDAFFSNCTNCVSDLTCITCVESPNIVFIGGNCVYCGIVMPKCLNCSKFDNCTLCSKYYALEQINNTVGCTACSSLMFGCLDCSSTTNCTTCSIGYIVRYGCSSVSGCISVTQNFTMAICDSCDFPQFQPNPINGICLCRIGHLAGRYCTQIIGCASVVRNGTQQKCLACNFMQYFQLNGTKCECRQYFELKGSGCAQICGDGILYVLPCDDGNTIDGDGCSSTCKVEKGYACTRGANHGISICPYDGKVSLSLQSINNLGGNSGSIVFKLSPSVSNFAKSNLTNLITFGAVNSYQMTEYSAASSTLSIFIKFEANFENTNASITLQYDSKYIVSPKYSLKFKIVQSNGDSLLYDPDYYNGSNELIAMPVKALSGLLWAAFFFASYSHKMIGVETLHTVQLIFIMQVCSQHYLPVVVDFSELANALNVYQKVFSKHTINASKRRLARIGYSADFLTNISVVAIIQLCSIFLFLLLLFVQREYFPLNKLNFSKLTIQKISSLINFLYRVIIFPITIGTYFHFLLSLMIHSNFGIKGIGSGRFLEGICAVALTFSTFFIFFGECKPQVNRKQEQTPPAMKAGYISFYLMSVFLISIFMYMALFEDSSKTVVYILAASELISSIALIFYRPYKDWVHCIGLLLNFSGIFINAGWIISQNYFALNIQQEELVAFAEIGLISFIITWSIIRTVFEIKKSNAKRKVPQKKIQSNNKNKHFQFNKDEYVRAILKENQSHMINYCLNSQLLLRRYEISQDSKANDDKGMAKEPKDPKKRKLLRNAVINEHLIQQEQDLD